MIETLRKRFIRITMLSVTGVLLVLMTVIQVSNFITSDHSAQQKLALLAEGNGQFPDMQQQADAPVPADEEAVEPPRNDTAALPKQKEDTGGKAQDISAETPYETRYFSVVLTADGTVTEVLTDRIAAVDSDTAVQMAQELQAKGKTAGYSGNYKYLAQTLPDGSLRYIFLDCTRSLHAIRSFLLISAAASAGGILAVFVLVVLLSKRAVQPLAESYEKQKQFITDAGHEIKTPLTIIGSCTEVIELEQGESKWTEGIRTQVKRLTALTASLVSLARMDEASAQLPMQETALTEVVQDALEPFTLLAESRKLTLACDLQPDIRSRCNEAAIRQLCSILADNAIKYALPESTIRFTLCQKGRKTVLCCENEAANLPVGNCSRFFDRFYRADASRSQTQGYGIGLSLAQSIVHSHGGVISARSADGKTLRIEASW